MGLNSRRLWRTSLPRRLPRSTACAPDPVREAPGAARSPAPGSGLGRQILDSLENLYRSGQSLSRPSVMSAPEYRPGSANLVMRTTLVAPDLRPRRS